MSTDMPARLLSRPLPTHGRLMRKCAAGRERLLACHEHTATLCAWRLRKGHCSAHASRAHKLSRHTQPQHLRAPTSPALLPYARCRLQNGKRAREEGGDAEGEDDVAGVPQRQRVGGSRGGSGDVARLEGELRRAMRMLRWVNRRGGWAWLRARTCVYVCVRLGSLGWRALLECACGRGSAQVCV